MALILRILRLLTPRDRAKFHLLVIVQVLLAFLDLVAVLLLAILISLSTNEGSPGAAPIVGGLNSSLLLAYQSSPTQVFLITLVGVVLAFGGKSIIGFLLLRRSFRFLALRNAAVSSALHARLLGRNLLEVNATSSQETSHALTAGVSSAIVGLLGNTVVILAEVALVGLLSVSLLLIDFVTAMFAFFLFVVVGVILTKALGRRATQLGAKATSIDIASLRTIQESVRAHREVTVLGRRSFYEERFSTLKLRGAKVQADLQMLSHLAKYIFDGALILGAAGIAILQLFIADTPTAIATIALFLVVSARIAPSILRIQSAIIAMRTSASVAKPTLELIDRIAPSGILPLMPRNIQPLEMDFNVRPQPVVSVRNLCFSYPGSTGPAIQDISFQLSRGRSLALVGATGAGKSTLADLILGLHPPDSGEVRIEGSPPLEVFEREPGAVAYVAQETFIAEGTIRENVALGIPSNLINDSRVVEALSEANFPVASLGDSRGITSEIGEHGVRLSGGERQRIGIARALYSKPRLLVLDEATSSLDSTTETGITESLRLNSGSMTAIVIAHRLSTIQNCDQVAFLSNGKLSGIGTYDFLLATIPEFQEQVENSEVT